MIEQPSKPHNNKYKYPWSAREKELLLTYAKANQVRDFHVPPDHRLSLTKYFF